MPVCARNQPGDSDGDGKSDLTVYNPNDTWAIISSATDVGVYQAWSGAAGDIPVSGDYDGDGKTDEALYNTPTGN